MPEKTVIPVTDNTTMHYRRILPVDALRKYIQYFWVLEDDSNSSAEVDFRRLTNGLPGMVFLENPDAFLNQHNQFFPQLYVYGQSTQHTRHKAVSAFRNIGVYFQPDALRSLLSIDAHELTDVDVDMNDITRTGLIDQLNNTLSVDKKIRVLSSYFLRQISSSKGENEKVSYCINQFQQGKDLSQVLSDLNISERSLERYFKQHLGISPKLYSRIARFQSALRGFRSSRYDKLTDLAYDHGYFDQAHFIRSFQEFAGSSPRHFAMQAREYVENCPEWRKVAAGR